MIGFHGNLSRFRFLIKIHINVWWSNPPRTSSHINSLFICLYLNKRQNNTNANKSIELGYKDVAIEWFVVFFSRDSYFNTKPSQSCKSNETVIGHSILFSRFVPSKKNYMKYICRENCFGVWVMVLILVSWYIHGCSIGIFRYDFEHSSLIVLRVTGKIWYQTGNALMNAYKK